MLNKMSKREKNPSQAIIMGVIFQPISKKISETCCFTFSAERDGGAKLEKASKSSKH